MCIAKNGENAEQKLKILQVVPILSYGGVEKMVINYFNHLDQSRFAFDFISHGAPESYAEELQAKGCRIYDIPTIGQIGIKEYKKRISEALDVKSYDVVHIHIGHITGIYAKAFRELGAKKIICHAHTTKCVNPKHRFMMPMFRYMANHYSDHNLGCGVMAGNFCFGKGKFEFLPNGIDYNLFKNVDNQQISELKKELGLEDCPFIVGHIAHFSEQKNHQYVIKIISEYIKLQPNAKFVLVGDGPDKEKIEKLSVASGTAKNIIFTGVRNDIPVLMKMFDAFILPSLYEGLPVVSIEAQAAGTPCLFSTEIDKTLNIGAVPVQFLELDESCQNWVEALRNIQTKGGTVPSLAIDNAMKQSGYDIASSAYKLGEIYTRLAI